MAAIENPTCPPCGGTILTDCCTELIPETMYALLDEPASQHEGCPDATGTEIECGYDAANDWWEGNYPSQIDGHTWGVRFGCSSGQWWGVALCDGVEANSRGSAYEVDCAAVEIVFSAQFSANACCTDPAQGGDPVYTVRVRP